MFEFAKTTLLLSLAVLCMICVARSSNIISRENLNTLVIRNMQQQMKTMEASLKLVQASCGKRPDRRDKVVAFHAKLKNTITNWKADAKIVFGDVVVNEGNGYNNNTGVFTSPSDGVYVFEWTILTYPGKHFHLDFMINNTVAAITHNTLPSNGQTSVSSSIVVKMKKGDRSWLEPHSSGVGKYAYGSWTYLSGFKL